MLFIGLVLAAGVSLAIARESAVGSASSGFQTSFVVPCSDFGSQLALIVSLGRGLDGVSLLTVQPINLDVRSLEAGCGLANVSVNHLQLRGLDAGPERECTLPGGDSGRQLSLQWNSTSAGA